MLFKGHIKVENQDLTPVIIIKAYINSKIEIYNTNKTNPNKFAEQNEELIIYQKINTCYLELNNNETYQIDLQKAIFNLQPEKTTLNALKISYKGFHIPKISFGVRKNIKNAKITIIKLHHNDYVEIDGIIENGIIIVKNIQTT